MTDFPQPINGYEYYSYVDGYSNQTGEPYLLYDDYDYDMSLTAEELMVMVPVAICYGIIFLLGITGNALVIYCVANYKRMKSITNQLLLSLACADLLLTLVCVPIKVCFLLPIFYRIQ